MSDVSPGSAAAGFPADGTTLTRRPFGTTPAGEAVECFTLSNAAGLSVDLINYGAAIVRLRVPDRAGTVGDVTLGYDDLAGYLAGPCYFGAVVGRFGNRIAGGQFSIDDDTFTLPLNDSPGGQPCSLHGGPQGFDKRVWAAATGSDDHGPFAKFTLVSPEGDAGYPGTLDAAVVYHLRGTELEVVYTAHTDSATPVNLTQHAYFNLNGAGSGDVLEHILQSPADRYVLVDAGLIPTGELASVTGTPFDFTSPHAIGARIGDDHPQLALGHGYDHTLVLPDGDGSWQLAAKVFAPASGRTLEVWTTEPGVQFYTGNFIADGTPGKAGAIYDRRGGFCLETQHFPDSPNQPAFPDTILRPGESYRTTTVFRFGTA